jgi:hypothetical protein
LMHRMCSTVAFQHFPGGTTAVSSQN